jgi:hypothetical protein
MRISKMRCLDGHYLILYSVKIQITYLIIQHPYERPNTVIQFQLFYKYKYWKHVGMLHRHERTCTGDVIYKYTGSVYHTANTVIDRLEDDIYFTSFCFCKSYTYTFKLNTCSNTTKSSNVTPLKSCCCRYCL